jgi:putative ABC transport system permease protein
MTAKPGLPIFDILRTAHQALLRNWGRAVLTSLSMVVGTASLVLVIVAAYSGRDYTMEMIQSVGTNMISIYHEGTDSWTGSSLLSDRLNLGDLEAIRTIPGIKSIAPLAQSAPKMTLEGVAYWVTLIGTTPEYREVRNLKVLSGHFIDQNDQRYRNRVCLVTDKFENKLKRNPLYKNSVSFYGIPFHVIGVFRERMNTMGLTEITENSVIIPITVMRYFKPDDTLDQIYVSAENMAAVPQISERILELLINRHRQQALYKVENLSEILKAADKISLGLTVVLLVIAAISLVASGISIMNVMLITVTERTREIGIKKAIGANRKVLLTEFLVEALILSGGGGLVGILLGVAVPYSIRFITSAIQIQIPPLAVILGFSVTLIVGLTFGMIPALRAARLNPVESLRYE